MVGSLHMARLPLGIAQREVARAAREDFAAEAIFSRQLLALNLQTVPLPLPQLTTVLYFALWRNDDALDRFRSQALPRWQRASRRLSLTLDPVQSFGSWSGGDPLAGYRSDPDPDRPVLLLTHSRTPPRSMPTFLLADRAVVRSLREQTGHIWAGGFLDGLRTLDTGTLSLWRSTADALRFAYRPGVHKDAVRAQRDGGWFTEAWFGRFGIRAAAGNWPGVELPGLLTSEPDQGRRGSQDSNLESPVLETGALANWATAPGG